MMFIFIYFTGTRFYKKQYCSFAFGLKDRLETQQKSKLICIIDEKAGCALYKMAGYYQRQKELRASIENRLQELELLGI